MAKSRRPSRREFLVTIGGVTLGTFLLPANLLGKAGAAVKESAASAPLKKQGLEMITAPRKLPMGPRGFSLLWVGSGQVLMLTPESDEEVAEAQRLYDASRAFDPDAESSIVHKVTNRVKDTLAVARRGKTEERLLAAIRDDLAADTPRLAYAEWLKKRGDVLGEFIEVACQLKKLKEGDAEYDDLTAREWDLLCDHEDAWLESIFDLGLKRVVGTGHIRGELYERGFIEELTIDKPGILPRRAKRLFAAAPILHRLNFSYDRLNIPAIVALPQMRQITSLAFEFEVEMDLESLRAIATSPHLVRLEHLSFSRLDISEEAARVLADSEVVGRLRALELSSCPVSSDAAEMLASSPRLSCLEQLSLDYGHMDAAAVSALVHSPYLAGLRRLNLASNEVGRAGARAIASSPSLDNLTALDLGSCSIDTAGLQAIASSPCLTKLIELRIPSSEIDTIEPLVNSTLLDKLSILDLSYAEIGPEDARALAASARVGPLEELIFSGCRIGPTGTEALANSPHLRNLRTLELYDSEMGMVGASALAKSPLRNTLRELKLKRSDVGNEGAALLEASYPEGVMTLLG